MSEKRHSQRGNQPMEREREKKSHKAYDVSFDRLQELQVFNIRDPENMYPFLIKDPQAGTYRVIKTRNGGLQMIK